MMAQNWTWTGEMRDANSDYYIMNVAYKSFIQSGTTTTEDINSGQLFTYKVGSAKNNAWFVNKSTDNRLSSNAKSANSDDDTGRLYVETRSGNTIYIKYSYITTTNFLGEDGKGKLNNKSNGKDNNSYTWLLINENEKDAFNKYLTAYNSAKSKVDALPSAIQSMFIATLNTSADVNNVDGVIETLNHITDAYEHSSVVAPLNMNSIVSNELADWTAEQGNGPSYYNSSSIETYGKTSDNKTEYSFNKGKVLYQRIEGLSNGIYKVEFYGAANMAWQDWATGSGIAQWYINDVSVDIEVVKQIACTPESDEYLHSAIVNVTDGTIEYGIKNIDVGGNWYVCKAKSLTYYGPSNVARTTKGTKYGTICMPFDFTANDATLYTISGINVNGTTIELNKVGTEGAAGVPYIYQASDTESQSFSYKSGDIVAEPKEGANGLVGTFALTPVPTGDYVMQTQNGVQGFYYVDEDNAVYSGSNKCYLKAPSSNSVKSFYFGSGEETAIEAVNALMTGKAKIYDMNGRKLDRLQKGVNIVNGKKVIVK